LIALLAVLQEQPLMVATSVEQDLADERGYPERKVMPIARSNSGRLREIPDIRPLSATAAILQQDKEAVLDWMFGTMTK